MTAHAPISLSPTSPQATFLGVPPLISHELMACPRTEWNAMAEVLCRSPTMRRGLFGLKAAEVQEKYDPLVDLLNSGNTFASARSRQGLPVVVSKSCMQPYPTERTAFPSARKVADSATKLGRIGGVIALPVALLQMRASWSV